MFFLFLDKLKKVTNFRPTIVMLSRKNKYQEWISILKSPESIKKDTEVLCQFAKQNNIIGYKLVNFFPVGVSVPTFIYLNLNVTE